MRTGFRHLSRLIVAVTLTATALTACGQQAAQPPGSLLSQVQPVKQADIVPGLLSALRSQLKVDGVTGIDPAKVFAAVDKQFGPMVADGEAELAKAPGQVGTAPDPIFKGGPSGTGAAPQVVVMAADPASREYETNKVYRPGDVAQEGGMKLSGGGVFQIYIENGEVFVHLDFHDQSTATQGTLTHGITVDAHTPYCPDAAGLSRGKLDSTFTYSTDLTGGPNGALKGAASFSVSSGVLGHVNDAANLTTYDLLDLVLMGLGASSSNGATGFYLDGYSLTSLSATTSPLVVAGKSIANAGARGAVHGMSAADARSDMSWLVHWAELMVQSMYQTAQRIWRDGHCVEVVLTKGPDPKGLSAGQTSRFTAEVHHKPDGAQLDKPIVAGESVNGVVNPNGKPTMPPAQFSFTAGSNRSVRFTDLTSTSVRGIGKLTVYFLPSYKLTIIEHSTGGGLSTTSNITGTVVPDPTGTFLEGPGTAAAHGYGGKCGGPWKDSGPITFPVDLKAVPKGDGSFAVQMNLFPGSDVFLPIGTFQGYNGVGTGTLSLPDACGTTVSTFTIQADPA